MIPIEKGVKYESVRVASPENIPITFSQQVYTVCGIYIGFAVLAFLLICFGLDPIVLDKEEDSEKRKFSFRLTLETAKQLIRSHYQRLLVILTMYSGIEQAFMTGDYTKVMCMCVRDML